VIVKWPGWDEVELPGEWWIAAGMADFVRRRDCYRHEGSIEVPIADLAPFRRDEGVRIFHDGGEHELKTAAERVGDILQGFASDTPLTTDQSEQRRSGALPVHALRWPPQSLLLHGSRLFFPARRRGRAAQ